jgi:hypothetical protein
MDAEYRLDPVKTAVLDHRYSTTRGLLFGVLEKENDLSAHFIEVALQDFGQPEQHRGMPVMPARMHNFGNFRPVWSLFFVLNREGVHVGAECNRRSGMSSFYPSDYPVTAHPLGHTDTQLSQPLSHPSGGVVLLKRQFGMLVQISPAFHHLFL